MRTATLICLLSLVISPALAAGRNIVLFVADDHGGGDLGCYGHPVIKTPNIDRLAAEGTRFDYAFCTTSSCSASRSVLLTGLHNHCNGMYGLQHGTHKFSSYEWVQSLPGLLSRGGYRTARIGKYHVAPESVFKFDQVLAADESNAVALAEGTRDFIAAKSDKPFFLYICTVDPHRRGGPAQELPYKPDRFGNPPPGKKYDGVNEIVYDPKDMVVPPFLPDAPECRAELAQYCQSVSRVDQALGRLVQHLKDASVYDDTLIIYLSDNGIAMPGAKTGMYEPGIRLPLIVRAPHRSPGVVSQAMVSWVDITPTILDFAGLLDHNTGGPTDRSAKMADDPEHKPGHRVPYHFHGQSFLSVVDQKNPPGWDTVYASHTFHEVTMYYPMRCVRQRRWKLIWNIAWPLEYPFAQDIWDSATWQGALKRGQDTLYGMRATRQFLHRPRFELYDLEADPDELHNLAEDPTQAARVAKMKNDLREFQQRTADPWVLKWDRE